MGIVEVGVRLGGGGMKVGDEFIAGSGGGEVVEEIGEEGSVVETTLEVGAEVGIFGVGVGVFGIGVEIRGNEVRLLDV